MAAPSLAGDPGSFRDRDGQVYTVGEQVLRGVTAAALDRFRSVRETRFFEMFSRAGEIVATEELSEGEAAGLVRPSCGVAEPGWAGWLRHERIPFISYPYEWTFGMLQRAALLQLRLLEAALSEGWTLKDASPYNVQFRGGKPVFIDVPSLEPARNEPWAGYRQFCQMYLFPLMLQAYRGVDFQPFLRARIDGIDLQQMARLFGKRDWSRRGVFSHVWMQAWMDRRYGGSNRDIGHELGAAGFNRELVLANVRRLLKLVERMHWRVAGSEWADYGRQHNYADADLEAKRQFVDTAAGRSGTACTWDLGCNTGAFAELAARHSELVVAMDADHLAVERLYRNDRALDSGRILPLVQDLADPSPAWGWNLAERKSLAARGRPQLVLALALVHHVVIGANIPLRQFLEWLAALGADLVIEFVSREDDKVAALLRNRVDQYTDYHPENFEAELARHFRVEQKQAISEGRRTLYHCRFAGASR